MEGSDEEYNFEEDGEGDDGSDDDLGWGEELWSEGGTPSRVFDKLKVIDPAVKFHGAFSSIISFSNCVFTDVTVYFDGEGNTYVFEKCVWKNSRVTFTGNGGSTYIFEDPQFTDSVIIGGEGELTLEAMQSNECIVTSATNFYFGQHPTFNNVTLIEEVTEDPNPSNPPRTFDAEEKEEVDFTDCELNGIEIANSEISINPLEGGIAETVPNTSQPEGQIAENETEDVLDD